MQRKDGIGHICEDPICQQLTAFQLFLHLEIEAVGNVEAVQAVEL